MLWAPCEGAPTANMQKWLGLALTVGVVVAALTAPWLAAIDPMVTDFASSLKPPGSPGHPLGTDQLGRDLLARVLYGARLALFIGACTVAVTAVVGGLLGLVSGRSEEHTSELQSLRHLVCRLLLEKKKTRQVKITQWMERL